jgi:hypothetical protein
LRQRSGTVDEERAGRSKTTRGGAIHVDDDRTRHSSAMRMVHDSVGLTAASKRRRSRPLTETSQ